MLFGIAREARPLVCTVVRVRPFLGITEQHVCDSITRIATKRWHRSVKLSRHGRKCRRGRSSRSRLACRGPDRGGAQGRAWPVNEGPGRCSLLPENTGILFIDPCVIEGPCRLRREIGERGARPVNDGDREGRCDLLPALPAVAEDRNDLPDRRSSADIRWKPARLSAPMIQMKWTWGLRARMKSSVRAV